MDASTRAPCATLRRYGGTLQSRTRAGRRESTTSSGCQLLQDFICLSPVPCRPAGTPSLKDGSNKLIDDSQVAAGLSRSHSSFPFKMTADAAIIGPSGGRDAFLARKLYPNFYKTRAGDPPERGATRKDFRPHMVDRKSILYPVPYLASEASRATWMQRATRGVPNISTLSLAQSSSGTDIQAEETRESLASLFEDASAGAQPLSVVYKRHEQERLPPSISFRPHRNLGDPMYYDMPPPPPYPAPPLLLKEQRRQRPLWSALCNSAAPSGRPQSIVFNPGSSSLSISRGRGRSRDEPESLEDSEGSFLEVSSEPDMFRDCPSVRPYPDQKWRPGASLDDGYSFPRFHESAGSLRFGRFRQRERGAARPTSGRDTRSELQMHRRSSSSAGRMRRASERLGTFPSRSVSVHGSSRAYRSSYSEESVPIPMPFWGRYDWYPPMKAPRQRIQAFGKPAARECVPLYESGLDDWTTFPWNEALSPSGDASPGGSQARTTLHSDRLRSAWSPSYRKALRATVEETPVTASAGANGGSRWPVDSFTRLRGKSGIDDTFSNQLEFRKRSSLTEASRSSTRRRRGQSLPRTECSFLCKEHRGRHVHLMDVFGPVERSQLSDYFDQDVADATHRAARGCLGVHSARCPESHNILRRVLSNCAERGKHIDLDAFPQQTREPTGHWWCRPSGRSSVDDEKRWRAWLRRRQQKEDAASESRMNNKILYRSDASRLY